MAQTAEVEETSSFDDLDSEMLANLREIQARNAEPEEVAPVVEETREEPVEPKQERPRAPDGKFVKESAAPAETPDTPENAEGQTEPVAAEPALNVDLNRAPSSWKPAAKAAWANLPPEIRAEVHRREADFHNTTLKGPLKENADFGQTIKQVIEPYRAMIEAEGGTPDRAVADLLRTAALFRTGSQQAKLQGLLQLDKQFNVGLQQYIQQQTQAQPDGQPAQSQFADPRVDQIMQSLHAIERERQAEQQRQAQMQERATTEAVNNFITAKDDKGAPLYPFVDNVIDEMNLLVAEHRRRNPAADHGQILKQAYEQAVWANPETRAVLIAQQQAKASQPEANLRKVEQAKRASAGNVPKRGSLPASAPPLSMDDTIRETAKALGMF